MPNLDSSSCTCTPAVNPSDTSQHNLSKDECSKKLCAALDIASLNTQPRCVSAEEKQTAQQSEVVPHGLQEREEGLREKEEDLQKRGEELEKREKELQRRRGQFRPRGEELARRSKELALRGEELALRCEELYECSEDTARASKCLNDQDEVVRDRISANRRRY